MNESKFVRFGLGLKLTFLLHLMRIKNGSFISWMVYPSMGLEFAEEGGV